MFTKQIAKCFYVLPKYQMLRWSNFFKLQFSVDFAAHPPTFLKSLFVVLSEGDYYNDAVFLDRSKYHGWNNLLIIFFQKFLKNIIFKSTLKTLFFDFRAKFRFSSKISIFDQNVKDRLSVKISMLYQNFDAVPKFRFSTKTFFDKKINVSPKIAI